MTLLALGSIECSNVIDLPPLISHKFSIALIVRPPPSFMILFFYDEI